MVTATISKTTGALSILVDGSIVMTFGRDYYKIGIKEYNESYDLVVQIPSAEWGCIIIDKIE